MFVSFTPHFVELNENSLKKEEYKDLANKNIFKVIALDIQNIKGNVVERKIKTVIPKIPNAIEFDPDDEDDEDEKQDDETEFVLMEFYVANITTGKFYTFTSDEVLYRDSN